LRYDALCAQDAIADTMVFHACGICDREFGLRLMHDIDSALDKIEASGIPTKFAEILAPLNDPTATNGARAYAAAAERELCNGIRRGCTHVCSECFKQLPLSGATDVGAASTMVPKLALVNGYFLGDCPEVLLELTLVEQSMISFINVVTHLAMLDSRTHYQSSATVFSVLNSVADIAKHLPQNPDPGVFATIIKPDGKRSPKALRYNPFRVHSALQWLRVNNDLYKDIPPVGTSHPGHPDVDIELPHVRAGDEDYEGIVQSDLEDPAGDDGHPVNPGAPASSSAHVFLHNVQAQDTRQQLAAIAQPHVTPSVVIVRQNGEFVADYDTELFFQKAFPHLFPYGRGGPGYSSNVKFDRSYITNMLLLGHRRSFQQCTRFIFYSYTWVMRSKVGTISFLAGRKDQAGVNDFTAGEARKLLAELGQSPDPHAGSAVSKARLWSLIGKLQPHAQHVPGTELFFAQERKKLMSMISSPATTSTGQWTWFFTTAQPDNYLAEIYDNAVTSFPATRAATNGASLQERRAVCDALTKQQRADMLRAHPFMSARIHALQQEAYWQYVLCGQRKPLGDIADYWMRVEFQMKGTPHWHTLLNITSASMPGINEQSVKSEDPEERRRVVALVESVATARLLKRTDDDNSELREDDTLEYRRLQETEWGYNIDRPVYFADNTAPARKRFDADDTDYSVNSATGQFTDSKLHNLYRRLQLANQMHKCRNSCYKYCRSNQPKVCRYGFTMEPVEGNDVHAVIAVDRDRRGRARTRVLPPRNNGNINNHIANPLCFVAAKGNQDIQYIQNTTGGAEYCSKYCAKAEAVESTALQNAVNRTLAKYVASLEDHQRIPLQWQLRAVGNAIVGAQQVGSVQACYMLGKLPIVKTSRPTQFVNCLKRNDITMKPVILDEEVLSKLQDADSALSNSPSTQHGKRDAFHALWKQQMDLYAVVHINFYAFLSSYTLEPISPRSPATKVKEGCKLLHTDENGFIIKPVTFKLGQVGPTSGTYVLIDSTLN
jgi:hypothetical protein